MASQSAALRLGTGHLDDAAAIYAAGQCCPGHLVSALATAQVAVLVHCDLGPFLLYRRAGHHPGTILDRRVPVSHVGAMGHRASSRRVGGRVSGADDYQTPDGFSGAGLSPPVGAGPTAPTTTWQFCPQCAGTSGKQYAPGAFLAVGLCAERYRLHRLRGLWHAT